MTKEQFDNLAFSSKTKINYNGTEYDIISVDFEEGLIGIDEYVSSEEDRTYTHALLSWKRFENCSSPISTI